MTEPPAEPITSGMLDGRYVLGRCVGQGGMARVYRAEDVVLGRTVAIKIMRTEAEHPAIPPRARTEMSLLASLNHPSLVTLFDAKVVPGQPEYLVMEFVEGTSLAVALQDGPLDASETAGIAAELASGLDTVHRAGIVHRDVKPSNVLLAASTAPGRRFWPKLADFGVAYLAPEQVRGEPAGPPADVYALGLLLLETITGDRAFPEASGIGRVMARLVETPEIPVWLGPEWSELIASMIAREPADRPTAAQVACRARSLPRDVVRPARPATVTLDEDTQAFDAMAAAPAVVGAASAPTALQDHVPRTRRASRPARRTRRMRVWLLTGATTVIVAAYILVGALWAGGAPGEAPAPEQTLTEPTTPAPAELVADDDSDSAVVTVDQPDDQASTTDTPTQSVAPANTQDAGDEPSQRAQDRANEKAKERAAEKAAVHGKTPNVGKGQENAKDKDKNDKNDDAHGKGAKG